MAKKTQTRNSSKNDVRSSDALTYRVCLAFSLAVLSVFVLLLIYKNYSIGENFLRVHNTIFVVGTVSAAAAAAGLVMLLVSRSRPGRLRSAGALMLVAGVVISASCFFMRRFYLEAISLLCFIFPAIAVYYLIFSIYSRDFFLISLLCGVSALGFYALSKMMTSVSIPPSAVAVLIAGIVFLALCGTLVFLSSRDGGVLKLSGRVIRILPERSPFKLIIGSCAVFIAMFIVSAMTGPMTAYYCIFAAAAYFFVMAVYSTIKLV